MIFPRFVSICTISSPTLIFMTSPGIYRSLLISTLSTSIIDSRKVGYELWFIDGDGKSFTQGAMSAKRSNKILCLQTAHKL
ncbi:hypothetical protein MNV_830006 [Candidatus Methanoperedens nitroreducens]|uniref:Uncharacterized protein n=1 Tax=Candidatus Methanoperedens nitratireducens TaxID=1392998 RepID=A0A284VTU8_9EURY|nr:hypothetical protein MNV_830006 [Candidatus Methanoperedens nitroreducens]